MDKSDAKLLIGLKNSIISFGGSNTPGSRANLRRDLSDI